MVRRGNSDEPVRAVGSERHDAQGIGRFVTPKSVGVAILVVLFVVWLFTNSESVDVTLFFAERSMPLWSALLIAFVVGVIVGVVAMWRRGRRRSARDARAD